MSKEGSEKILILPLSVLRRTHDYFLPYWRAGVETACFWFGSETENTQVVTSVAVPKLFQTAGNYRVEPNSWRRLVAAMRDDRLTNLAQVHTHPIDYGVKHSWFDDAKGYSTSEGALSLVWANYGHQLAFDLASIGVHERSNDSWVLLDDERADCRIRIVDDFADFRWEIESGNIYEDE